MVLFALLMVGSAGTQAPASSAKIYIVDSGNDRIVRIDDMTGAGWTTFGTFGDGTNQFSDPKGIFVDTAGRIYVTDDDSNRIVRVNDMNGSGWATFGSSGNGKSQFSSPRGVFVR